MSRHGSRCGLSLVELIVVIAILGVLFALSLAAIQKARDAASRTSCANNLRQLGLALHQYHNASDLFPPGVSHPIVPASVLPSLDDPYPLMTWSGRILPFIEQDNLWQQMVSAYGQDWNFLNDPPHTGRTVPVPLFLCPADRRRILPGESLQDSPATISYSGVAGVSYLRHDGMLYLDSRLRFADVIDGMSYTLMAGERPPDIYLIFGCWYPSWGHWLTGQTTLGVNEAGVEDWISGCPYGPYQFGPGNLQDR